MQENVSVCSKEIRGVEKTSGRERKTHIER